MCPTSPLCSQPLRHISHVVNYDMPDTADAYIHRVGRTARASRTGNAINLATKDDLDVVTQVEVLLNKRLECVTLDGFDYEHVPAVTGPGPRQSAARRGGQRDEGRARRSGAGSRGGRQGDRSRRAAPESIAAS